MTYTKRRTRALRCNFLKLSHRYLIDEKLQPWLMKSINVLNVFIIYFSSLHIISILRLKARSEIALFRDFIISVWAEFSGSSLNFKLSPAEVLGTTYKNVLIFLITFYSVSIRGPTRWRGMYYIQTLALSKETTT